jgi:hypothetical protein
MGKKRSAYNIFVGKPEENRPLGRPTHRWANIIRMDLREVGWEGMWTGFIWLRRRTIGWPL